MADVIPLKTLDDQQLTTQGAYPSDDDLETVKKFDDWWSEADKDAAEWLKAEKGEHAFALGHQWDTEDYERIKKTGRVPLVINKTLPTLMVVSGYERMNRMRVRYMPAENADANGAEVWSEVVRDVQEKGEIDFNKSEAFFDSLKGGRGFLHLRLDTTYNPKGEIVSDRVPPWELRIDPSCSNYDLSDARYLIWARYVSYEELLLVWPEKAEQILAANMEALGKDEGASLGDRDSDYDSLISKSFDKTKNKWCIKEVWYWQVEKTAEYQFFNPQKQEWQPITDKASMESLLMLMPQLQYEHNPRYERKYYQAFVVGPLLLQNDPSPYEYKGFPFVPFYGLRDEEVNRHIGMVYPLIDPQSEINKRRTQVLHIINQSAKSGWKGPKGAFVDRDVWEEDSGKPGVILEYEIEPQQAPPEVIQPPPIPAAFIQLEQMATIDVRDVSGVNIELLGMSHKDTPGIVTQMRQRQGMTILQSYFDNLRRSTKIMGRMLLSMMQQFYTDGRQFVISGKQPVQIGQDMKVGRYDLIAEEAPWSPNQRMETAVKLEGIIGLAIKAGIPIPPDVLDYLDLPESFTEKWKMMIERMMGAPQGEQPAPPPDPLMQADQVANIEKTRAEAQYKQAQAAQAMAGLFRPPMPPQQQ